MALVVIEAKRLTVADKTMTLEPWSCRAHLPASVTHPSQLADEREPWFPALVPGTVAAALQVSGQWDLRQPLDADTLDWWYRTTFAWSGVSEDEPCVLCLDGLATHAEVWLNGQPVLTTANMFRAYRIDIAPYLEPHNELTICFRSLTRVLAGKRPRPRWKTSLVNHQQLRWQRTSLLGRIPGWSPCVPPIGPWRAVRLETGRVLMSELCLNTALDGTTGVVTCSASISSVTQIKGACLRVSDHEVDCEVLPCAGGWMLRATLRLPDAPLWWPHTHGSQPLLACSLSVDAEDEKHEFACGPIGFRKITALQDDGFAIEVNDVPVYCRGACWTVGDIVTLNGSRESLIHDLRLARDAGVNMLRIGGTMIYESDSFYDLCDELGILVWQDFMFANMDYPVDDRGFAENIEAEARYQLGRLAKHPCVAIYCGNSEVEQQAAMVGMPRELWRNAWFGERLPALCAACHPSSAYVPSTPSGGVMPFHVGSGIAHYYGIGAYLRSIRELRQADVKFTPECLAFANIPQPATVDHIMGGSLPALHHPDWKKRVPRDAGAGWDFEDVRDHYLKEFFGVDPVALRSFSMPRYLHLSRVVPGEMMAQVFAEWRSGHSRNQGALVWFFKDLWPGAGWGMIDSLGCPKAVYYYLRRSWANRQITMTDEGLDGLHVHVINETAQPLHGTVELVLLKDAHIVVARQCVNCELTARARHMFTSEELLGAFYDVTYAYRFGPPHHDVVIATLYDQEHQALSEAVHFVQRQEPALLSQVNLDVHAAATVGGCYQVTLRTDRFLQSVSVGADGFLPDDNYFHLAPDRAKVIDFRPREAREAPFAGYVEALNLKVPVRFSTKNTAI